MTINMRNSNQKYDIMSFIFQSCIFHLILHLKIQNLVCMAVGGILIEGNMSQNFVLSFRTRTYIKNLRHSSLHSNVFNTSVEDRQHQSRGGSLINH